MWHMFFFWLIAAIEYQHGVVYAVPHRFQKVSVKVRSQPGHKRQILKLTNFNKKCVFLVQFNLRNPIVPFVCGTSGTAVNRI